MQCVKCGPSDSFLSLKVCVTRLKWEPSNEAILNVVPSIQGFIVGIEEDTDTYIKRQ